MKVSTQLYCSGRSIPAGSPANRSRSSLFGTCAATKLSFISCMWLFPRRSSFLLASFSHRVPVSPLVVWRSVMDKATLFQSIGLSEQKSQETLKNDALSKRLEAIITLVSDHNSSIRRKVYSCGLFNYRMFMFMCHNVLYNPDTTGTIYIYFIT